MFKKNFKRRFEIQCMEVAVSFVFYRVNHCCELEWLENFYLNSCFTEKGDLTVYLKTYDSGPV